MPEVTLKDYGLVILSIFLNQKSYKNLPRKESSNLSRILREFKHFNWARYFLIIFLYQSGMREGWARDQRWKGMGRRGTEDWGGMNRARYFLIIFLYQSGMREGWARDQRLDRLGTCKGQARGRQNTGKEQERKQERQQARQQAREQARDEQETGKRRTGQDRQGNRQGTE
jgi:hypothetical protein